MVHTSKGLKPSYHHTMIPWYHHTIAVVKWQFATHTIITSKPSVTVNHLDQSLESVNQSMPIGQKQQPIRHQTMVQKIKALKSSYHHKIIPSSHQLMHSINLAHAFSHSHSALSLMHYNEWSKMFDCLMVFMSLFRRQKYNDSLPITFLLIILVYITSLVLMSMYGHHPFYYVVVVD